VVARMFERGYSLDAIRDAARGGRLAFGYAEDLFEVDESSYSLEEAAEASGLEPELISRLMTLLGTPMGLEGRLNEEDVRAMRHCAEVLNSGFPLVAFLQLVRVYAQSIRKVADAEVRLFHLYVHEPLMQDKVPPLEIAEEMGDLVADLLPVTSPLMEYMHNRYLRFYIEQDVVGHMEADVAGSGAGLARVSMAFCFVDLTGFTRYTEEEGDEEALDMVERFVETVEATLPSEAQLVKTIGDEVMVVSPDPSSLTEWSVGFLALFQERPQPRVGIHYGAAVFRDGDYFGGDVNLAHRVVNRALGGEVLVTESLAEAVRSEHLRFDPIGEVSLKGFPEPIHLLVALAANL
jgi:adenylate cyclase